MSWVQVVLFFELLFKKVLVTYVLKLLYVKVFSPIIKSESLIILKSLYLLYKLQFSGWLIKYHCKSEFHLFIKVGRIIFFLSELIRLSLEGGRGISSLNIMVSFTSPHSHTSSASSTTFLQKSITSSARIHFESHFF